MLVGVSHSCLLSEATKSLVNEFYKMKEQLVYKDGVGLNRFYKLHRYLKGF